MTDGRRIAVALGCVVCLLLVATALPAADPRIPSPGSSEGDPAAGEWDAIDATPAWDLEPTDDEREAESDDDRMISVDGPVEAGGEVLVTVDSASSFFESLAVEVNDEPAGETDQGNLQVDVPYAEEMTVRVPEENLSRTFDVETDATIETGDGAAPNAEFDLSATVGSTPLSGAAVSLDGEPVTRTDDEGDATVTLPERTGPADLRVERGPVEETHTVEIAEPTVAFVSPLLFPGSPAPVQVSADGAGVADATVSVEGGGSATTDDDGRAYVWLPIDDEATVTATVGEEPATATAGNLYLRLAALVVFVPGIGYGLAVTYVRLAARREGRRGVFDGRTLALAGLLAGLSDAVRGTLRRPTLPASPSELLGRFWISSLPRLAVPRPTFRPPRIGSLLPSIGAAMGSLSVLASLRGTTERSDDLPGRSWSAADDEDDEPVDGDGSAAPSTEPLTPHGPRAEIRAAWHAFLDRLGVTDRETMTPGQAARRATADGFPGDRVERLVAIFRDVEYGGRDPSVEQAAQAHETASELADADEDEEGSP
ncbi:DUF4129 domain-containing protein [Halobacteria archaeon AArc-dxtr1]|nr:DUF4129 domain-containing protein [Halobacteria archaeon AArc-dxtr1]